jgi:polyketide cyclase/dehydrase/lipid transport protein
MTTVEYSIEVDATPEEVWAVTSDPRGLPAWERHIESVSVPAGGLKPGARYDVTMSFMGVRATVPCLVREWEAPWRSVVELGGLLKAEVRTSIASLPFERSVLRHEVTYVFRGPLGSFAAASVRAVGGAEYALRRGTEAQRRQIEAAHRR